MTIDAKKQKLEDAALDERLNGLLGHTRGHAFPAGMENAGVLPVVRPKIQGHAVGDEHRDAQTLVPGAQSPSIAIEALRRMGRAMDGDAVDLF